MEAVWSQTPPAARAPGPETDWRRQMWANRSAPSRELYCDSTWSVVVKLRERPPRLTHRVKALRLELQSQLYFRSGSLSEHHLWSSPWMLDRRGREGRNRKLVAVNEVKKTSALLIQQQKRSRCFWLDVIHQRKNKNCLKSWAEVQNIKFSPFVTCASVSHHLVKRS